MKKAQFFITLFGLLALLALVFGGCDNPADGDDDGDLIAVTGITGVCVSGAADIPITFTGTVQPVNATNKTITWSVQSAGTTGSTFTSTNTLTAIATGTLVVRAAIANGTAAGTPYIQDFTIDIISLPAYAMISVPAGTVSTSIDYNDSTEGYGEGPFADAGTTPVTVPAFNIGETEITYALWKAVLDWAIHTDREIRQYTFPANTGKEGDDGTAGAVATNQEPVTNIRGRDMIVWCNSYSEATGKTPVYYLAGTTDFNDTTQIIRESEASNVNYKNAKAENAVINPSANGFRLPTETQWEYAGRGGDPADSTNWSYLYAGSDTLNDVAVHSVSHTAEVKSKDPNSLGLYDMSGNLNEFCEDIGSSDNYSQYRQRRGGHYGVDCTVNGLLTWRDTYNTNQASQALGFRVVTP
ncbi:MAG: formylglycine-generating enzyme family protein [Spirochaetaceae bacterium]|nr:formylglycine-generating enzyme family protein [Spirochaetaceae bacterium]